MRGTYAANEASLHRTCTLTDPAPRQVLPLRGEARRSGQVSLRMGGRGGEGARLLKAPPARGGAEAALSFAGGSLASHPRHLRRLSRLQRRRPRVHGRLRGPRLPALPSAPACRGRPPRLPPRSRPRSGLARRRPRAPTPTGAARTCSSGWRPVGSPTLPTRSFPLDGSDLDALTDEDLQKMRPPIEIQAVRRKILAAIKELP